MGAAVPLGDCTSGMILEVRQLANMEVALADEPNAFIRDSEIKAWLNADLAELCDLVDENEDDPIRIKVAPPYVTQSGVDTYALPADFKAAYSLDVYWGQNMVRTAHRFNLAERNRFKSWPQLWGYLVPLYYMTQGDNLIIQPVPQGSITLYLKYVPAFQPLVAKTDTFDSINQWHQFAIYGAVARCLQKDDDSPALYLGLKDQVAARVRSMIAKRNLGEAPRVTQTRGPWRYDE